MFISQLGSFELKELQTDTITFESLSRSVSCTSQGLECLAHFELGSQSQRQLTLEKVSTDTEIYFLSFEAAFNYLASCQILPGKDRKFYNSISHSLD